MRYLCIRRNDSLHIEAKALAVFMDARQFGNHTGHLDVASLPCTGKTGGQALFGLPCGVIEAEAQGKSGKEQGAHKTQAKCFRWDKRSEQQAGQQPYPEKIRQCRLLLQQPHAQCEECGKNNHMGVD